MNRFNVYGIGNALVDLEFRVTPDDLTQLDIEKGVMTLVEEDRQSEMLGFLHGQQVHRSAGGSAANTVIALSQLGGSGFYSCKVADDELGHLYTNDLETHGIATNAHERSEPGNTGRCLVMVTEDADRTMCTYLGITGNLGRGEIVEEALRASEYLYIEGYLASSPTARDAVKHAREIAQASGVGIALSLSDPNVVRLFGDGLREMVGPGVDLLFSNEEEALEISNSRNIDDAVTALRSLSRQFVITRGAYPALVHDGKTTVEVPARHVKPLDTTGAGDMFAGAFLYGLSEGWGAVESAELANAAAARLIASYGPRLDTASMQEVLREHKPQGEMFSAGKTGGTANERE